MRGADLPMRTPVFLCFFCASACYAGDKAIIEQFSEHLRSAIALADEKSIKKIPIYPKGTVDEDTLDYLLRVQSGVAIRSLMRNADTRHKIHGPFLKTSDDQHSSYLVIFYNPEKISLDQLSNNDIEKNWGINYIETIVTLVNGVAHFYLTPFYYGAHPPWANDYDL